MTRLTEDEKFQQFREQNIREIGYDVITMLEHASFYLMDVSALDDAQDIIENALNYVGALATK